MKTLDRYILREFSRLMGLVFASLVGIYLIVEFFERIDDFVEHNASLANSFLYFLYKVPLIIYQITPIAALFPTILLINQLTRSGELTAIKTSGISLSRTVAPILVMSLLVSALVFVWGDFVVGPSLRRLDYLYEVKIGGGGGKEVQQVNIWVKTERNEIWNISRFQPREMAMHDIVVFAFDENKALKTRTDAEGAIRDKGRWRFKEAFVRNFADGQIVSTEFFEDALLPLRINLSDLRAEPSRPEREGFRELMRDVQKRKAAGLQSAIMTVDMHSKLSYPLASFVMVLLGIPFSLGWERSGKMSRGIMLGLIIGASYWVLFFVGISLGHTGLLPPVPAAWGANILLSLTGLYLMLGTRQ